MTLTLHFDNPNPNTLILSFKKKGNKLAFEMEIDKGEGFLHPFVAIYSSGDKISI